MKQFTTKLIEKYNVAKETFLLVFQSIVDITPLPGQFLMLSKVGSSHFLNRPFAFHYYDEKNNIFEVLIRVKGDTTAELTSAQIGSLFSVIAPLGNNFPINKNDKKVAVIAGGIGIAPIKFLLKELLASNIAVDFYYGETNYDYFVDLNIENKMQKIITTDDGSYGIKGYIIDSFSNKNYDKIFLCGPEIIYNIFYNRYKSLAKLTYVSMERIMACGVGACKGCQINTINGPKLVCKNGPIFRLDELLWK